MRKWKRWGISRKNSEDQHFHVKNLHCILKLVEFPFWWLFWMLKRDGIVHTKRLKEQLIWKKPWLLISTDVEFTDYHLSPAQFTEFEIWKNFLEVLCDVTVVMSIESDVTLSLVVPYFNVFLDHIESFATHHNHTVQDAAEEAKIKLTSYYQKTSDVYTIAVVLDLRLNVHYCARDTSSDAVPVSEIKNVVKEAFEAYKVNSQPAQSSSTTTPKLSIKSKIFASTSLADGEIELNTYYLQTPVNEATDVLKCWSNNKKTFPILHKVAFDFLAIPSTSTLVERKFSSSGQTITPLRNRLNTETVRAIQCLKSWM